jgi:hypothetical protein
VLKPALASFDSRHIPTITGVVPSKGPPTTFAVLSSRRLRTGEMPQIMIPGALSSRTIAAASRITTSPMAHGAVRGAKCDPSGPFAGYAADGSVLVCPPFGQWTLTSNWAGVHEIGSKCRGSAGRPPENSAVSPGGVGLICVATSFDGWAPGSPGRKEECGATPTT